MRIVKLEINDEEILSGVDAVALVERPAIEETFMIFSEEKFEETYNDYPKAAIEAAKRGIELNKENNMKCATQVGKVRAQQLVNGENLSLDTVRRMRNFLIRQKDNYELALERKDYNACGYISYLLWGGEAALPWTEKKLRQAGDEFTTFSHETIELLVLESIVKEHIFSEIGEIDGLPFYSTPEEAEAKASEIGCSGHHVHTTPEGLKTYMPCSHHGDALDTLQDNDQREFDADVSALPNYINELPEEVQEDILNQLGLVGEKMEGWVEVDKDEFYSHVAFSITSTPNDPSQADFGQVAVRYRYDGPRDSKNRDFCAKVLNLGLVFRREDINNMSLKGDNTEFGTYDIFRYKGSYNCRHRWQEVFFKRDNTITDTKKPEAISNRILDGTTYNNPVIQKNGIADREIFSALDEQQIVIGPLMTPNKLINRVDENGEAYYVYFDEQTIEEIAYKMMREKLLDKVNIEHNDIIDDAYMVETWIVKDPEKDKANFYGYTPKKGQWFGMYKIANKDIWDNYVKTGKVKGFSVEGWFTDKILLSADIKCLSNGGEQFGLQFGCTCGKSQHPKMICDGSHEK